MGAQELPPTASPSASEPVQDVRVVFHTDKGDIDATLFASSAPVTVASFLNLAQQKFYDGLRFHRVDPGFHDRRAAIPRARAAAARATSSRTKRTATASSTSPASWPWPTAARTPTAASSSSLQRAAPHLNDGGGYGHYTIFGQVTKGQEIVDAITQGDHIKSIDILDPTAPLFAKEAEQIDKWNRQMATRPGKH